MVLTLLFGPTLIVLMIGLNRLLYRKASKNLIVRLTPDDVIYENWISKTSFRWDKIVEIRETDEFFLFHPTRRFALILPKRVVREQGNIDQARYFLRMCNVPRTMLQA